MLLAKLCLAPIDQREAVFQAEIHEANQEADPTIQQLETIYSEKRVIKPQALLDVIRDHVIILSDVHWAMLSLICLRQPDADFSEIDEIAKNIAINEALQDQDARIFAYLFLVSRQKNSDAEHESKITSLIFSNEDPAAWVVFLNSTRDHLVEANIKTVRKMTLPVFNWLGHVDPATTFTILSQFALLKDVDITLNLISLGLSPEFPLEIIRDIFTLIPDMANCNQDELLYLFFLEEKLKLFPNEYAYIFDGATKGLLAAIKYYPESNKIQELQGYFLTPALQHYRSSLPENKERPSYERPPSEAYPNSRPASLRVDGNARPLSIKIVAAPTSTAAPPKPPKPQQTGAPVNFYTSTSSLEEAKLTGRRSTWFGGLPWTKK